jgi:hypothetical protein
MLIINSEFLSYWRIKKHFVMFLKYIYYFFYLFQTLIPNCQVNFYKSKEIKKIFTFVKSPKCYKRGKRLFKFNYYKYGINFKITNFLLTKHVVILTFLFFKNFLQKLSTLYFFQYKTIMSITTNLEFLEFLC